MQATVELPESIYRRAEQAARAKGTSVDALISEVLERELGQTTDPVHGRKRVSYPIMDSSQPGTLDFSDFNFDDLLT